VDGRLLQNTNALKRVYYRLLKSEQRCLSGFRLLDYEKPKSCSPTQQSRELTPRTPNSQPRGQMHSELTGFQECKTSFFITHNIVQGRDLPHLRGRGVALQTPASSPLQHSVLAIAQAALWSCLLAAPTCSFLVGERPSSLPLTLTLLQTPQKQELLSLHCKAAVPPRGASQNWEAC